jgi:hypothetical protein
MRVVVVVFRFFYDLDVAATADALGCSEGNSQGSLDA